MKRDTLFEQKEATTTCENSMSNANEYQKLLKPPTKQIVLSKGDKQIWTPSSAISWDMLRNTNTRIPIIETTSLKKKKK